MPLLASSKRPRFCCTAPVNAPRSCPNNSLSARLEGSAPQFTLTMTASRRRLNLWMRARDQLLAGTGLAKQEDGGVGIGHPLDGAEHLLHDA